MKTLTIAAMSALIALSATAASAQTTGASTARPASATTPANTGKALTTLRNTIVGLTNASVDYSTMTPEVASKVREQIEQITPLLRQFGPLKNAQALGIENGAEKFRVTFDNQTTEWLIGFNDSGKIAVLLFRPVS